MDMENMTLDRNALRIEAEGILARLHESIDGCGSSYELFQRRFSASVERARRPEGMSEEDFIEIARTFDYATAEEIAEGDRESGSCSHGFDPDCCPCGCGDRDDGSDDFWAGYEGEPDDPEPDEPEPDDVETPEPASVFESVPEAAGMEPPAPSESIFARVLRRLRG